MRLPELPKTPTGITGLDEITGGGLPKGRPTLVCGSAGCGKTLLAMEFLVRGATQFGDPGVFIAFEETAEDLATNVASLGFDVNGLIDQGKLSIDHIHLERSEIEETGEYDLEGLFIRLGFAIDSIGAKRVVLDTIETLFGGFSNETILRAELRRLFGWLKERGVTAIITGERGDGTLTRQGLEEYVSDCVILLEHRVERQNSSRRLRIVKYRGSTHGTNEYPFLIDDDGFSVLPVTSASLNHSVSNERVSTGIEQLDAMLGGVGVYRGSSTLISGTAGTGKTSLAAHIADAACRRGETCLYFSFEESPEQIVRNMRSIGINLQPWIDNGTLHIHAARPTMFGLEMHLAKMHKTVLKLKPHVVVVDPVSNLIAAGAQDQVESLLIRLIDFLKVHQITAIFTSLNGGGSSLEATEFGVSSVMDTWLLVRDIEIAGERNRGLYVLKSRGTAHSNQIREFLLTEQGIRLLEPYLGLDGVLTGSARAAQELRELSAQVVHAQERSRARKDMERKQKVIEAQIAALQADLESNREELEREIALGQEEDARRTEVGKTLAKLRRAN